MNSENNTNQTAADINNDEQELLKQSKEVGQYRAQDMTAADSMVKSKKKKGKKHRHKYKHSHQLLSFNTPEHESLKKKEEDFNQSQPNVNSHQKIHRTHILGQPYNSGSSSPMSFSEVSSLHANSSSVSLGSLFEFKSAEPNAENKSFLTTGLNSQHQHQQVIKSPRLSPLQNFDQYLYDFLRKVDSDFPYAKKRTRKSYMIKSIIESLPEMVEEEKIEEEEVLYKRSSRFSVMMDNNEFGKQGNRHRSLDGFRKKKQLAYKKFDYTQSQYVSETEEELYSDEDEKRNKKKKIFSLGYFSQLMNKRIYSDDFDMSSDKQERKRRNNKNASLMECPISEDVESEDQDDYLSDQSSSSTFSFQKKKMSFYLSRLIDKFDPLDNSSSNINKGYYSNVNETIQEEDDEEIPGGLLSSVVFSKLKAQHDKVNSFKFLQLGNVKQKKIKSICLESEPILEELEEYNAYNDIDQHNHTFIIPRRDRIDSMEIKSQENNNTNVQSSHLLPPILEKRDEDDNNNGGGLQGGGGTDGNLDDSKDQE